jgi:MurNAc alpha-1-phosphate uridylyltransferase
MKINTALILCAGYGKRLSPLTLKLPKPLLELQEITLLERTINLIKLLGIKKIILNTFYLKEQIESFIKSKNFEIEIKIIEDGNVILNTGGGIFKMINSSNENDFLVFNPDTIWKKDYLEDIKKMEEFYFTKKIENILMVVNKELSFDKNLKGDFNLLNNILTQKNESNFIYIGCQIINKRLFKDIIKKSFSIFEIWETLMKQNLLYGYENKRNFFHITNLEIFKKLSKN